MFIRRLGRLAALLCFMRLVQRVPMTLNGKTGVNGQNAAKRAVKDSNPRREDAEKASLTWKKHATYGAVLEPRPAAILE
ncbi:hypothetical protein ANCCEY_12413 [Ancylostoma ceylanicum]|uniref:Secreted protein n=1 Tax=Ancylostoma ceylanicum TaxID=53326 RepID=A0A0D6L9B6_9BILA|nr:hypothetical protein ANCCEY_12413 [Ancylostoma ceylanicum]